MFADLPPNDAVVVLELLEDLIKWLNKSQTFIQREFMHTRYAELREHLNLEGGVGEEGEEGGRTYNTSTNPFAIPFDILEFKGDNQPPPCYAETSTGATSSSSRTASD